jgi:hypothetical protein
MVAGVLFLMLVLLASLLAAFIYQIVTTPLTAVDAPTLVRSAAPPSVSAPALPVRQPRAPRASRPARGTSPPGGSGTQQSRGAARGAALLAIAGLAAVAIGGWLFLRIARGAAACSPQAIQICSQGFVLLTGAQLAGGAIALAGLSCVVVAIILALR